MHKTCYKKTVSTSYDGQRLDKYLAEQIVGISRTRIKFLIEDGKVNINNQKITDPAYRVKLDQSIKLDLPIKPVKAKPAAQSIKLDIIFEDSHLIIINKPCGLVVHPAPGNPDGTLVNALIAHCGSSLSGIGGERRPGIVHRLDKDTSGLMVAAKNDAAHFGLAKIFENRDLTRIYSAIVWGTIKPTKGQINGNIGRSSHNRKKMCVVNSGGKPAETHYLTLDKLSQLPFSLVECQLKTGRTHQIRVHLTHIGHPIIGDKVYGSKKRRANEVILPRLREAIEGLDRQALHARSLAFKHPITGNQLSFETNLPSDMNNILNIAKSCFDS